MSTARKERWVALVKVASASPRSIHFAGAPPEGEANGSDSREEMPFPRVLLIAVKLDGIFLERYMADGTFAGDTWHKTLSEARSQADSEYGADVTPWRKVPEEIDDPITYALSIFKDG